MDKLPLETDFSSSAATMKSIVTDKPNYTTQFIAAFICCLAALSGGMVTGFTSPAIPDMKLQGRSLTLTPVAKSWMSSIMPIGGLCGGLLGGIAIDYFGRKSCLIYTAAIYVIGWLFIIYANAFIYLYIGRFLTGACLAITSVNAPVYLAEIASPPIRGIFGNGFILFASLGVLLAYSIGAFVPWSYLAVASTISPLLTMILMIPMPETPVWLVKHGKIKEAVDAVKWLRGSNYDYQNEIIAISSNQQESAHKTSVKDFLKPNVLKAFLILLIQFSFHQSCGYSTIIFYASDIFKASGSTINPNTQAIVIAVVMVISSTSASFFIDKAGRRILLLTSMGVMSCSLLTVGGYYYLLATDSSTAAGVSWLPMVCLIVIVAMFNFGLGPVPYILVSELFPMQVRGIASSLIHSFNSLLMFAVTNLFEFMVVILHPYGTFWLYGTITFIGFVFVLLFIPETKGKSLEQIQSSLSAEMKFVC